MGKKTIIIASVLTIIQIILLTGILNAQNGWELRIKAKLLNAENTLIIGQRPDAQDGIDGRYDVPALLAGDIEAYIELEGAKYWRDIKGICNSPCAKQWDIFVESKLEDNDIKLNWDSLALPGYINITLTDIATGMVIDMKKQPDYVYENMGKRQFKIEMQK